LKSTDPGNTLESDLHTACRKEGLVKITIIFPGRSFETAKATASVMPLAPCLLAALTPAKHEISLVDMFFGDRVDYEAHVDVAAITVRTPLALIAYEIADHFLKQGKKVVLGGPHVFAFPEEAKQHASAVAIGEGEELWPQILRDIEENHLKQFYGLRALCRPEPARLIASRCAKALAG
jgi:hypothetical protein